MKVVYLLGLVLLLASISHSLEIGETISQTQFDNANFNVGMVKHSFYAARIINDKAYVGIVYVSLRPVDGQRYQMQPLLEIIVLDLNPFKQGLETRNELMQRFAQERIAQKEREIKYLNSMKTMIRNEELTKNDFRFQNEN